MISYQGILVALFEVQTNFTVSLVETQFWTLNRLKEILKRNAKYWINIKTQHNKEKDAGLYHISLANMR